MAIEAPDDTETRTAKLFMNGRSQAVRLPKEFRFEGSEVVIRKEGKRVILEPKKRVPWPEGYIEKIKENAEHFQDLKRPPQGEMPKSVMWADDE